MKKRFVFLSSFAFLLSCSLSGCSLIGDIFKAGVGFGILLVVVVLGLIFFAFSKMGKK